MPGVMGSLGSVFGGAMPALEGVSLGSGIFGNIMNAITRGKAVGNLESAEKKFSRLTPEQLSGLVTRAEQPLGQDLLNNVGNLVQADMATRGLAEAPGIFASTETTALAPYKLQQQQMALELVMKQLGLPIEYAQAILQGSGGGGDLSQLMLMMLMNQNKGGGGGGGLTLPEGTSIPKLDDIMFGGLGGGAPDGTTGTGDWSI